MCFFCRHLSVVLLLSTLLPSFALCAEEATATGLNRGQKTLLLNVGSTAAVIGWGVLNWDYFSRAPSRGDEGWFGSETASGGADKLGHAYTSYLLSHSFSSIYRAWGYATAEASRYGCYSALGVTGIMEMGDAFSANYGFSYEDMLMNLVGAGFGFLTETCPALGRKVDFRWEYRPDLGNLEGDFVTDYEHSKYLLAVKAAGFNALPGWLKPFEVHFGYYVRSAHSVAQNGRLRTLYTALGINLTRLLRPYCETRFFDYFQMPYIYLALEHDVD
ncbi:MAG: DUF2279 domain-containing protein [Desulfuromonadales bacterium]|nr:DUF2279 domain-containing protein [Desulfuromonadales bacterium]